MDMKKKKRTHLPFISVYSYTWVGCQWWGGVIQFTRITRNTPKHKSVKGHTQYSRIPTQPPTLKRQNHTETQTAFPDHTLQLPITRSSGEGDHLETGGLFLERTLNEWKLAQGNMTDWRCMGCKLPLARQSAAVFLYSISQKGVSKTPHAVRPECPLRTASTAGGRASSHVSILGLDTQVGWAKLHCCVMCPRHSFRVAPCPQPICSQNTSLIVPEVTHTLNQNCQMAQKPTINFMARTNIVFEKNQVRTRRRDSNAYPSQQPLSFLWLLSEPCLQARFQTGFQHQHI